MEEEKKCNKKQRSTCESVDSHSVCVQISPAVWHDVSADEL